MLNLAPPAANAAAACAGWEDAIVNNISTFLSAGAIGVAALMALVGAFVVTRGARTAAQLKTANLWFGLAGMIVLVAAVLHMWDTRHKGSVIVTFSPNFAFEELPEPSIKVAGKVWKEGDEITLEGERSVYIFVEGAIGHMKKQSVTQEQIIQQMQAKLAAQSGVAPIDDAGQ